MHALLLVASLTLMVAAPGKAALRRGSADAGQLSGRVTDVHGTGLDRARVTVVEAGRTTLTDVEGRYTIAGLPSGTYTISFAVIGFRPQTRRITLGDEDLTVDVAMTEALVELPSIQVTATPTASATLASPQPTAVLAGGELRNNQSLSLGETIRLVPGVHNWSTGTGVGKPVIRGLSGNSVLVLANGQRTETQQWGDEHSPDIETTDAARIEVIKGPASVLYGSDALGGVVNIVARDLPDAIGKSSFVAGSLSGWYASNNTNPSGTLMVEGGAGLAGWRGTLFGRTSGDIRTPGGPLNNSAYSAVGGSAALGFRGSWGSVSATYAQRNDNIQIHEDPAEDPNATPFQLVNDNLARVVLTLPLTGSSRLEADVGYQRNKRREYEEANAPREDVAVGLTSETWTPQIHYHHAPLGPFVGTVGAQGIINNFGRFGSESLVPESRAFDVGLFGFESGEFGRWTLSFGLRYDWRQLEVDSGFVGRDTREILVAQQVKTYNSLTGNLGILYRLSEPTAIALNVGRGYRAPNTFELYSYGVHEGTQQFLIGDENLTNETSLNTDLSFRVQGSKVSAEVGGFLNLINNYIYPQPTDSFDNAPTDPNASGLQEYQVTQGNATLWGLEAAVDWHPAAHWEFKGTTDYVWTRNEDLGVPLPWIPPFRAFYQVRYNGTNNRWYVGVAGESHAQQGRPNPDELAPGIPVMPGYTLANLMGGVSLPTPRGAIKLDLEWTNVLNTEYTSWMSRYREYALNMGGDVTLRVSADF